MCINKIIKQRSLYRKKKVFIKNNDISFAVHALFKDILTKKELKVVKLLYWFSELTNNEISIYIKIDQRKIAHMINLGIIILNNNHYSISKDTKTLIDNYLAVHQH